MSQLLNDFDFHVIGGGTFSYVRNHLALAAPAFGTTALAIEKLLDNHPTLLQDYNPQYAYGVQLHLTKMAGGGSSLTTSDDVSDLVDNLIANPATRVIIFNAAMCDFTGQIGDITSDKYATRLQSRQEAPVIQLTAAEKVLKKIRKERKDIFLVAFKTTCGATEHEQYIAGLNLLKENSCNIVLANDTLNHRNMIIVPEEAKYSVTTNRQKALETLVDMTVSRSHLTFTRSTVVPGDSIDWNSDEVPASLRTVVNYCIEKGAYKPFRGNTAGHFAVKVDDTTFLTSKRSTNFNNLDEIGLVKVESTGKDNVVAYGAKPSVGGMSQRIIFTEHPDVDCIVHFHCPPRPALDLMEMPVRKQFPYECGSHECGQQTSDGLNEVWHGIKAVYLEDHGPNVVFNRNIDPSNVIRFIDHFFDLSQKTGGAVSWQ